MDPNEMRFRAQQSPRSDATTMNSLVSPPRNRLSQNMSSQDPRSTLSRRFTTDSGRVPTLSSSAAPRGQDPSEYQVSCRGCHLCGGVSVWLRACLRFSKTQCAPGAWPSPPSPAPPSLPCEPLADLVPDADYATSSVGAFALVSDPPPDPGTEAPSRRGLAQARALDRPAPPPVGQHVLTPQQIEKKRMEYEKIREQKRLFDAELAKHEVELGAMLEEHGRLSGHQSEPTTPPEYRENPSGFPSVFSRPNRYSLSSLTSPPGLANRSARSGSVLASPQSGVPLSRFAFDDQLPSWSVPGSRRNSDEDEKEEAVRQDPTSHRSTNAYVEAFPSGPQYLVEVAFCALCLRYPLSSSWPKYETRAIAVTVMGLWPSMTMPRAGL